MTRLNLTILATILVASCGQQSLTNSSESEGSQNNQANNTAPTNERIFVFKPDGSLQCSSDKGTTLKKMEKELAGIKIHSRKKRHDGLLRAQICGSVTGQINVFEIDLADWKHAMSLKFQKLP